MKSTTMQTDYSTEFDKMRPYNNKEFKLAISRVLNDSSFDKILQYIYMPDEINDIKNDLNSLSDINSFQKGFVYDAFSRIISQTSTSITYDGIENLKSDESYLFISNHRDIVLDAALFQKVLTDNKINTGQITFGDNLMSSSLIIDLGKLNKMFTFYRDTNRLKRYQNALLHSEYIYDVISRKQESVWIAQRDGRTKDGRDITQPALLKMLVAKADNAIDRVKSLNIVPISISYEIEPCDVLKARELVISSITDYEKSKNEDLNSIITGLTQAKGRIHISITPPINNTIDCFSKTLNVDEFIIRAVGIIDNQIVGNYKCFPNNYIAADIISGNNDFIDFYNSEDKTSFIRYVDHVIENGIVELKNEVRQRLIEIYAAPVFQNVFS